MARGELTVSGWVYDIGEGHVHIAEDNGSSVFVAVTSEGVVEEGRD
jgi:carbonic anhydrase